MRQKEKEEKSVTTCILKQGAILSCVDLIT